MKADTIMNSRVIARGRTASRYGFRQMKVYVARNDRVCVGLRQVKRRMIRFWKTKTIPMRALKRRKLLVIKGKLNAGLLTYSEDRRSTEGSSSTTSSEGMTWERTRAKSRS